MNTFQSYVLTVFCGFIISTADAQLIEQPNVPTSKLAVPFLLLSTDAISSGMGESGSALLSSSTTAELNTAKANFLVEKFGMNLTYTPWLRKLVSDRKLMFVGGFYKVAPEFTLTASLNYLSYGQTDLIDINQISLGTIQPVEYVGTLGISKSFGSKFSLGMKLKIIRSNLYTGSDSFVFIQSGTAYGVDLSSYHIFPINSFSGNSTIAFAINVENIGPKISYFNQFDQKSYLPTNLKIGTAFKTITSSESEIGIALDFNKLLVPQYQLKSDESVFESIVSSFDGKSGSSISDVSVSMGAEYIYNKAVSFRLGYNLQGDKRLLGSFFSAGVGATLKKVSLNMAYITGNPQRSFLSNTLRFTLGYSFPSAL
ncbi:hypothetical protein ASE92_17240 [Pedobacter sp. Leaf41]|uniref:type IX secretion system outer membrane channel protein PorV n=1 Tax=Pedobacter sp. Leaf41 TaxID=1736218 RepID=UPI0007026E23|nr:type IX secretion system outer membrane channel protein PorV [Pedobacter sp. Leaf41]KQN32351.1 hypothetical protein ASE92_17240 [Pedobacter sp. Leaf41]